MTGSDTRGSEECGKTLRSTSLVVKAVLGVQVFRCVSPLAQAPPGEETFGEHSILISYILAPAASHFDVLRFYAHPISSQSLLHLRVHNI